MPRPPDSGRIHLAEIFRRVQQEMLAQLSVGRLFEHASTAGAATEHHWIARDNLLWQARFNTFLKTDIGRQIRYVCDSGCIDEILALKIWRRRHALKFPSFLMELAAIHARPKSFRHVLEFLATGFPATRLLDPANSNNVVSDLLTEVERLRIAAKGLLRGQVGTIVETLAPGVYEGERKRGLEPVFGAPWVGQAILSPVIGVLLSTEPRTPESGLPSRPTKTLLSVAHALLRAASTLM